MRRIVPLALALVFVAAGSIVVTSCGGGGDGNGSASGDGDSAGSPGAKVFAEAGCANCHTLKVAGATGKVGPDLDETRPNEELVVRQVTNGGNGMPSFKDKLSPTEIREVAKFVATSAGTGNAGNISFEPDDKKIEDCGAGDAACFEQAFGNLAYEDGPKAALDKLAEMQSANPTIAGICHPIAHKIGAGGLLHYEGSVGKAFAAGNATCGAGFYHGLLQWKLAGVKADEVGSAAATACKEPEIEANAFNYYQCNHGLGHGLMLYTALDLPKALDYCHQLQTESDSIMCSGGVFMENQSSSFGLRSKWLSTKNLLFPCNSKHVGRSDKLYCYLLVTSHILPNVSGDWKKTADWCRRGEQGWIDICFQSYGRDVAGNAGRDPQGMKSLCAQAGSGEKDCIFGAIRDVMNNNPQDPNGAEFCKVIKAAYRDQCFFGMGSILGTQQSDPDGKRAACEQWAKDEDLTHCLEGAGV
jgi:mono/diheme cytochrome c family protein